MHRKHYAVAVAVVALLAIGGVAVASAVSPNSTPSGHTVVGPDGKVIKDAKGHTIRVTDAQMRRLPPPPATQVKVTADNLAQLQAQGVDVDASDIGGEVFVGQSIALYDIIGTHPADQAEVDAAMMAAAATPGNPNANR